MQWKKNIGGSAMSSKPRVYTPRTPKAQRKRKLDRYFYAAYSELNEAIYRTAGAVNALDADYILRQLAESMEEHYAGQEHRKVFRAWAIEWVKRMACLTSQVKSMEQALIDEAAESQPDLGRGEIGTAAFLVLRRLHLYPGDQSDLARLSQWAKAYAVKWASALRGFLQWREAHKCAVFDGIWEVLLDCEGLGPSEAVVNELAQNVWHWAYENADALIEPGAPIIFRLKERAYWVARAWKTDRLRDRDDFVSLSGETAPQLSDDDVLSSPRIDVGEPLEDWDDEGSGEEDESPVQTGEDDPIRAIHFTVLGEPIAA
jgi:hypothetical protein